MNKKLLLFALLLSYTLAASTMKRVLIDNPEAVCLDGSPSAYYIEQGSDSSKLVLYFEGGGWCGDIDLASTLQNCYQRSKTFYGSSSTYPSEISYSQGMLSDNVKNHYRNATKVMLRYCDGSGHQGHHTTPVLYKDAKLYFRGRSITLAQLESLESRFHVFSLAEEVIVTGGSAGGLAAFIWVDYIREHVVKSSSRVYCLADSGIFLDSLTFNSQIPLYSTQFLNLFKLTNTQQLPPVPKCTQAYPSHPHNCMMAQYLLPFIDTPILAVQSLYDSWSIPNILNITCIKGSSLQNCNDRQRAYIEEYRQNTTQVMEELARRQGNWVWGLGCATHGFLHDGRYYSQRFRVPMDSANSIDEVLVNWVSWLKQKQESKIYIDWDQWPSNRPCSGTQTISQQ